MPLAGHAPDEIAAWLRLLQTPGCGRQRARQLLAAFGSPEGVFAASSVAQRQIVGEALVQALRSPPDGLDALVDATLDWLAHPDHHLLILGDEGYPPGWMHMPDSPLLLHLHGAPQRLNDRDLIALVGSRHPTASGAAAWASSPDWRRASTRPPIWARWMPARRRWRSSAPASTAAIRDSTRRWPRASSLLAA
jgi:DNA processing protein